MKTELRFRLANVGPVDDAELELGDLTIIAGRNNTGKTYLAYALYGFLREFRNLKRMTLNSPYLDAHIYETTSLTIPEIEEKLLVEGRLEWEDDQDDIKLLHAQLLQEMCGSFTNSSLSRVFNTSSDYFKDTTMGVDFSSDFGREGAIGIPIKASILWCHFDGTKIVLELNRLEPETDFSIEPGEIYHWMKYSYLESIFQVPYTFLGRPIHILSSSRLSISLFFRELDSARSQVVRSLQQMEDDHSGESPQLSELLRQTSRYPLPIQDNINFTRDLPLEGPDLEQEGPHVDIADIIGGRLEVKEDNVRFISRKIDSRSFDIPLHLASSSVGEMTNLFFFLARLAGRENYVLIIDEPESHLDTANQIQIARLLVSLVNSGTKVLITTHSDYIIKEINNLIMLDSHFEDKEEVTKRLGYRNSLDPSIVRAYVAENNSLTSCRIDQFGIDMPVFDKTIDEINKVSNELASRLAMELEEE